MKIDILTLFPQMFDGVLCQSILKRGVENGYLEFSSTICGTMPKTNIDRIDDAPFGGGQGSC